ncbi:uncharacterized protein ARMOST_18818 [Armillaria ostoyae]|uniref:Uncharacterized protein n=1 Tax=Armillaria ostoyae TaxID=47428 RepID=A0A284S2U9_ARMOS|nr:uncharacterized protein ARMOST_18818 [Armillaria ostoyae]
MTTHDDNGSTMTPISQHGSRDDARLSPSPTSIGYFVVGETYILPNGKYIVNGYLLRASLISIPWGPSTMQDREGWIYATYFGSGGCYDTCVAQPRTRRVVALYGDKLMPIPQ